MLTLDNAASDFVRSMRRKMADAGIPVDIDDPPHVSLASCATLDVDPAVAAVRKLAESMPLLVLSFESAGSFLSEEGTVFIAPVVTPALSTVQQQAMSVVTEWGGGINPYYASGRWMAHCTVANRLTPPDLAEVLRICSQQTVAVVGHADRLELAEFGDGPFVIHASFPIDRQAPCHSIRGLHHAQITIPNGTEEGAREFYCGVLRLNEVDKPASLVGRGGFWLQVGDRQVHVGAEPDFDRTVTKAHLAYAVHGLTMWRAVLTTRGIEILDGVPIPGYDRFEFRDPFGNRVEMIEAI